MLKQIFKKIAFIALMCIVLGIGYIVINIIAFDGIILFPESVEPDEIHKEAVFCKNLKNESFIICKWVRITGFNFGLIKNEYGMSVREYVVVSGIDIESELSYEFLTAGNSFVFYVVEKREYFSEELGENCTEYIVSGWDVLYPVKHNSPLTRVPKYILKNDCYVK